MSSRIKTWYDQKARQTHFEMGQKVWLHNPRKVRGKTPKLQSSWEGPYYVERKLNDAIYCIRTDIRIKLYIQIGWHRILKGPGNRLNK